MAFELKRVDYTTKDYFGYREDMVGLIPKKMPEWTDRSPNDPGIVILELLAYQLDKESYYVDRVANEVFLPTATQRRSVINHCKLIGYDLAWQTASKHWQVFEFVPQVEDFVIPKGTLIGTPASGGEESVIFETLEDLRIPAGATGLEKDEHDEYIYKVEVEQGQTITNEFLGTVSSTEGSPEFTFVYSPVLKDSIRIWVEDFSGKREWEQVTDFIGSTQDSLHYVVEMDEYDRVTVRFGNGTSGKLPQNPSSIYADYKVGGGREGNVGANTITEVYDSFGGLVTTFNPYGAHVLGEDKESLDDAKWKGPASLKRLDRYVTIDDYEKGVILDVAGISKAKAVNVDGDIDLYILPKDGTVPTQTLKDEIAKVISEKKVIFTKVAVKDPIYTDFELSVDVIIYDNYDEETIRYSARNVLTDLFSIENQDFGDSVKIAEIHHALIAIQGVSNAIVKTPVGDIKGTENAIPRLTNLTVLVNGKSEVRGRIK